MANEPETEHKPEPFLAPKPEAHDLGSEYRYASTDAAKGPAKAEALKDEPAASPQTFIGYPVVKYHPIYGQRSAADPNEAYGTFQPPTDWFDTAEEADMHRTHTEALQVMHQNQRVKLDASTDLVNDREPAPLVGPDAPKGVVRNSVAAQASLDAGRPEPL